MKIVNRSHDYRSNYVQLRGLIDLCIEIPFCSRGIEIGAGTGDSTEILTMRCQELTTIDPIGGTIDFEGAKLNADETYMTLMEKIRERKVQHLRMTSDAACQLLPNDSFGFVYIDGFHSFEQCYKDIENYWPKLMFGGILCGHDFGNPLTPGISDAINKFFGHDPEKVYLDWSWYIKKVGVV